MNIFIWGIFVFSFALLAHLLFWRRHLPTHQTKALFWIFCLTLGLALVILNYLGQLNTLPDRLHLALFVLSLGFAYIANYSAIEADSPTLIIVAKIAKTGAHGLTKEQLQECLGDDLLIRPRIKDLLKAKMVLLEDNRYRLLPRGALFIRFFIVFRRFLGLGRGG